MRESRLDARLALFYFDNSLRNAIDYQIFIQCLILYILSCAIIYNTY